MKLSAEKERRFEDILALLSYDFDRQLIDDEEFVEKMNLPQDAFVIFQIKVSGLPTDTQLGEVEEFNQWVEEISHNQIEPEQSAFRCYLIVQYRPHEPQPRKLKPFSLSDETLRLMNREFEAISS